MVVMGELAERRSPASAYSPMLGADLAVRAGARLALPLEKAFEHALLILDGNAELEGQRLEPDTLYYIGSQRDQMELQSRTGARAMLIGGAPFKETVLLWWNFVARSSQELMAARQAWQRHELFGDVKAYRGPRLDAPEFSGRPIPSRRD
jgi:quercetin 2,3-dioxygenase